MTTALLVETEESCERIVPRLLPRGAFMLAADRCGRVCEHDMPPMPTVRVSRLGRKRVGDQSQWGPGCGFRARELGVGRKPVSD